MHGRLARHAVFKRHQLDLACAVVRLVGGQHGSALHTRLVSCAGRHTRALYGGFHHPEARVRGELDVIAGPLCNCRAHTHRRHSNTKKTRIHPHGAMASISRRPALARSKIGRGRAFVVLGGFCIFRRLSLLMCEKLVYLFSQYHPKKRRFFSCLPKSQVVFSPWTFGVCI